MGMTTDHSDKGDHPRWIDTSVMMADSLMKVMDAEVLGEIMMHSVFDMTPTPEKLAMKGQAPTV